MESIDKKPRSNAAILKDFFRMSIPTVVVCLFGIVTDSISIIFAGRLGDTAELTAVGLFISVFDFLYFPFVFGLNSAQETITSQAFGAGALDICGTYLHLGNFILNLLIILPITLLFFYNEPMLLLLG